MSTILIGYDEKEESRRALAHAADLGQALGASLVVASVAPIVASAGGRSIGADPTETSLDHRADLAVARDYLDHRGLSAQYVEAVGHEADGLIAAAETYGADMIVVGSRDVSHLHRLLGHSVSRAVADDAKCDVLIVH